jgi:Exo-beta-D-glucosaminidase Ig-fold domain
MYEAQSKNRMGLLILMSHPCWPSMVWQTYDYYLEPTAGYFGAKKASEPLHIQAGLSATHFIRLELKKGDKLISDNFYLHGTEDENYQAIRTIGKATIQATTTAAKNDDRWVLMTTLQNTSSMPALMVRLKAAREKSGDRILPVIFQ